MFKRNIANLTREVLLHERHLEDFKDFHDHAWDSAKPNLSYFSLNLMRWSYDTMPLSAEEAVLLQQLKERLTVEALRLEGIGSEQMQAKLANYEQVLGAKGFLYLCAIIPFTVFGIPSGLFNVYIVIATLVMINTASLTAFLVLAPSMHLACFLWSWIVPHQARSITLPNGARWLQKNLCQ